MESIFNIFGTQPNHSVKLQQRNVASTSTFPFKDSVPLKQRPRAESYNDLGKRVLGDLGNTFKNKQDLSLKPASLKPVKTPLQEITKKSTNSATKVAKPRKSSKNKTPTLKSSSNALTDSVFLDDLPKPEVHGMSPAFEDDYDDIWPIIERPTHEDLCSLVYEWKNYKKPSVFESPPSPIFDIPSIEGNTWLDSPMFVEDSMYLPVEDAQQPQPVCEPWAMD